MINCIGGIPPRHDSTAPQFFEIDNDIVCSLQQCRHTQTQAGQYIAPQMLSARINEIDGGGGTKIDHHNSALHPLPTGHNNQPAVNTEPANILIGAPNTQGLGGYSAGRKLPETLLAQGLRKLLKSGIPHHTGKDRLISGTVGAAYHSQRSLHPVVIKRSPLLHALFAPPLDSGIAQVEIDTAHSFGLRLISPPFMIWIPRSVNSRSPPVASTPSATPTMSSAPVLMTTVAPRY